MTLLSLVAILIVVGVLLWALHAVPMDEQVRQIIRVIVIVAVVLWIVSGFFGDGRVFNPRLW